MSTDAMFKELQEEFLKESLSLNERFEYVLLNNTTLDLNLVNELFRIAHSIKGGAAAVGLKEVSEFIHKFENFLSQFRTDPAGLNAEIVSVLLEISDFLRNYFVALCAGLPADRDTEPLLIKIGALYSNPTSVEEMKIASVEREAPGLRMTSLQPLFQRLQRTLRDLSIKLNKPVDIRITGEETEIDRNLFEQLPDPLIHLVRNAIDHGIESSSERRQNAKSTKATIELKAYYESGRVIIEIIDDGKGIDTEVIYKKCVSEGLIPSQKPITDYSQDQIFQFIFLPGFSTAKEVSDLSGRGVGLDVVKTTLERFHGKISVMSKKGLGSSFKMHLPLTTSLIDGITFLASMHIF